MANKKMTSSEQLDNLTDSLVNDIIELNDSEIFSEAKEQYSNPSEEIDRLRGIIKNALLYTAKEKLRSAKDQLNAYNSEDKKNNVIRLSITQKRKIIENFTTQDPELTKKLTLAARNGEGIQTENDIDGMLEDMFELGLIDEDGNPN